MNTHSLLSPPETSAVTRLSLFEKGFRPFFLLGAAFAVTAVPLWLLALRGGFQPGGDFGAMQWHAHEMLFGFCTAIIAGFLLTAVSNWTGKETATGWALAGLAVLWSLGRMGMFFAVRLPKFVPALLDVAFLPALAITCALPLVSARSQRNYGFVGLLFGLSITNGVAHVAAFYGSLSVVEAAQRVALDVIVVMIVVITGRVVPMFTRNATRLSWVRSIPLLERSALALVSLVTLADIWPAAEGLAAPLSALAAALLLARMRYWATLHTRRDPLLWILHVGTLCVPLGFALRAAASITPLVAVGSWLHTLTAGAIGALTLGMMARVSLGHTGRMLKAPRGMGLSFLCVVIAALVRVVAPVLPAPQYLGWLTVSAVAWSSAFALFVLDYWRVLTTPRADAR